MAELYVYFILHAEPHLRCIIDQNINVKGKSFLKMLCDLVLGKDLLNGVQEKHGQKKGMIS